VKSCDLIDNKVKLVYSRRFSILQNGADIRVLRDNNPTDLAIHSILLVIYDSFSRIIVRDILNLVIALRAWGTPAGKMMVSPSFICYVTP